MGWDWTAEARAALNGGHTAISRVDVWHSGFPVYTLAAVGGQVTMDATRAVRANLECDLVDPTGRLSRGDVDDLLNPYDCEIAPWRGVRVSSTRLFTSLSGGSGFGTQPFGVSPFGGQPGVPTLTSTTSTRDELAPLGVFRLTGRRVSDTGQGLTISLAGQDRAITYQGPMASAMSINAGTPVEVAIRSLLSTRQPGLSMLSMATGFTVGPRIFPPDIDVWAEAQKLAEAAGARLFHDRTGQVVLAVDGPMSDRPVAAYVQGGGLLADVRRTEDSDTIKNVVIAENMDGTIRVRVEDSDPTSPTFARGRYGEHVYVLKNPHITSLAQARQAAATRLAYELGRSETVSFTAAPDPGLDVNEVVTVHRPRAGLTYRGVVTASITIPLRVADGDRANLMQVDCRQSRLAQDGLPLDELPQVAA